MARLGDFEVLGNKFSFKVAQIHSTFSATLRYVTFEEKTALVTFWATIGKFGLLLIQASGHTVGFCGLGIVEANVDMIVFDAYSDIIKAFIYQFICFLTPNFQW